MNTDYSLIFANLSPSDRAALQTLCDHTDGLYQYKTSKRFQSLVTKGLAFTVRGRSRGLHYKAYDSVALSFYLWNKGAIAS